MSASRVQLALLAVIAVLVVAVITVVSILFVGNDSDDSTSSGTPVSSTAPADTSSVPPSVAASPAQTPPVEGAYLGAGGPRPAGAEALPTYVGRYSKLTSAHLLTPTGGIGCDFNVADASGKQGQCGVKSLNASSSPLGCVNRVGTCKGKWLLGFADNRVGEPYDSSGTTGWMNQPASDGYQVPVVHYGHQCYFEDWVIASEFNGLTVWNITTGSGVFLSNQKVERFDGPGGGADSGSTGDEAVVLGSMPSNGRGYGTAKPAEIYAGGSPTSRITGITWTSWGGESAEGAGTGVWRDGGQVGREQNLPVTVVASELGTCNGKRAYMKITWYFPTKGEKLGSRNGMTACWGR